MQLSFKSKLSSISKYRGTFVSSLNIINFLVCICIQTSKINIPNLIYSNKKCTKIIREYNHFQYNTSLTTLLINESVFQSGKQRLNAPHTPLSGLSHQCCLNILLNLLSLLSSSLCKRDKDILRRLYKEWTIHFCKC
jgi:hypothetical protein